PTPPARQGHPAPPGAGDTRPPEPAPSLVVRYPDGQEVPQASLREALRAAVRSKAEVILRDQYPYVFQVDEPLSVSSGAVTIRAAAGARPILTVELKGNQPFLQTTAEGGLTLEGLTFRVRYVGKANSPPVIRAAGKLTITSCAFTTSGRRSGSQAIEASGLSADLSGCWFENFERALVLKTHPRSKAHLEQCLAIAPGSPPRGWVITASPSDSHKGGGRLELNHCTFVAAGLLEERGFPPRAPLVVEIQHTVVRSKALLQWTSPAGVALPKPLRWSGRHNRYHVDGASWVLTTNPKSRAGDSGEPTDLDSWKARVTQEDESDDEPVRFPADRAKPAPSHRPEDFALEGDFGVDPKRLGPLAKAAGE
ncbi:MAG: hypothetical protein IRY99_15905, partial [Isosphaeraceae bacterium]|nr:hypothetical protein [Isosphaeraceae bacterium]